MTREDAWTAISGTDTSIDESLVARLCDDIYGSRYQFLSDDALDRVVEVNDFYDYYDLTGQYWTPPSALGYTPTIMPVNLAAWFTNKRASWLFEVAPDVECPAEDVDKPDEMEKPDYVPSRKQQKADDASAAREQMLYRIWGENRLEENLLASAKDYFIGGTVGLVLRYLPGIGIRTRFMPAQEIFPVPDDDEPDKFKSIHFCSYYDNDRTVWKQSWELINGICYLTEGTYNSANLQEQDIRYNRYDTGLDFIPAIMIPYQALSGDMFGRSYLKDLIPLMDQYNRSMSDAADGLRFNLFAVTVLLNAPPDSEKTLKLAPQELWNIGGEGVDAKKLESSFNYSNALADFLTRLENLMHLLGNVPDITPDRIKGFGLVSGVALKLLYSDLVSATQQEWRVWKSRLMQMNEYVLRMLETYQGTEDFPYSDMDIKKIAQNYNTRIIPHLPLPENEAEKIQMEVQKLASSLQSVKGALQELGEKYPERKIAEMLSEREKFMADEGFGKRLDEEEKKLMGGL
jgi:hypothetical protein